jgi:pimeloyl-ACP methyl ester carboxylesterase
MKKHTWPIILILFTTLCANVFGQATTTRPFEVKKSGQGKQAIIFIPGLGCSGEVWNETVEKFEKTYTCYTLTMAGFAGVQPQPEATFTNWETQIARYIRENNIQKPILIGHSVGGGLTLAIAADYPQLVKKIIVVDALPCLSALQNPTFKPKENNDCTPMINQFTSLSNEQFEQMQKVGIAGLVADTLSQKKVIGWTMQSDRKTFAGLFCDFLNTDLREKLKAIQCPALILLESPFIRIKPAIEEQYKNLKAAQLQYSSKALHFIMFDDKEWYQNQLTGFIK